MRHPRHLTAAAVFLAAAATAAQRPAISDSVKGYVRVNAPVVALTNVRVIDGTGAPARERQTIVIRDDRDRGNRRRRAHHGAGGRDGRSIWPAGR